MPVLWRNRDTALIKWPKLMGQIKITCKLIVIQWEKHSVACVKVLPKIYPMDFGLRKGHRNVDSGTSHKLTGYGISKFLDLENQGEAIILFEVEGNCGCNETMSYLGFWTDTINSNIIGTIDET